MIVFSYFPVIRFSSEGCSKQNIVVDYDTVSSDALNLDIFEARRIMERLLKIAEIDLNRKCAGKTIMRLGTVNISIPSSSYQITGEFEYLPDKQYRNWNFLTCPDQARILSGVINDIKLIPEMQGKYSNFTATEIRRLPIQKPILKKCCPTGSVRLAGSCGKFLFMCF